MSSNLTSGGRIDELLGTGPSIVAHLSPSSCAQPPGDSALVLEAVSACKHSSLVIFFPLTPEELERGEG